MVVIKNIGTNYMIEFDLNIWREIHNFKLIYILYTQHNISVELG